MGKEYKILSLGNYSRATIDERKEIKRLVESHIGRVILGDEYKKTKLYARRGLTPCKNLAYSLRRRLNVAEQIARLIGSF